MGFSCSFRLHLMSKSIILSSGVSSPISMSSSCELSSMFGCLFGLLSDATGLGGVGGVLSLMDCLGVFVWVGVLLLDIAGDTNESTLGWPWISFRLFFSFWRHNPCTWLFCPVVPAPLDFLVSSSNFVSLLAPQC